MSRDDARGAGRASPTAFADWTFHRLNPTYRRSPKEPTTERMLLRSGRYEHEWIERLKLWARRNERVARMARGFGEWKLVYADPPDEKDQRLFRASRLLVDGVAVHGRPDVVLRDVRSGGIIILERKVVHTVEGRRERLREGYPNNWCQMWCYGWVDDWLDAPYVMLVLQYRYRDCSKSRYSEPLDMVPVNFRDDAEFHARIVGWFDRYGGRFVTVEDEPSGSWSRDPDGWWRRHGRSTQ